MGDSVFLGVWTNWSRGAILGPTLTTTKTFGNLLIAFTAFFVAFLASRAWSILCFLLHTYYSSPQYEDAIYHQRQIILRNSTSPESGLVSLLQMLWAWKRFKAKSTRLVRIIVPLTLSLICLTLFTFAGGFSSKISTSVGDEVLIQSESCGFNGRIETQEDELALQSRYAEKSNNALNYAQQCYGTNVSRLLDCNKFALPRLPKETSNSNAECPFSPEICQSKSNLRLDSGYIESHSHFGINAHPDLRFLWRYVLHCGPLRTEGYTTSVVDNNTTWAMYHYGNRTNGRAGPISADYIYREEDVESQYRVTPGESLPGTSFKLK